MNTHIYIYIYIGAKSSCDMLVDHQKDIKQIIKKILNKSAKNTQNSW